ncbi:nucleophile aminohydrolase [Catenaria anguillulae PL171]|uniref:Proteasome subunit beta n=1 Tax=Catenaria anguillulae PL171 TaxID=765915 RepID=A0A1Y2I0L5_9FUNG|nr:nucleophile aminohydrolase [Catenaria anguillulae PL171]
MDYFPANWGQQRPASHADHNWLVTPGAGHSQGARAPSNVGVSADYATGIVSHTSSPIVTGTSVVAFKFKDGIIMATDCLASYGSLARFRNMERMTPVGQHTIVGASGDVSDFSYIKHQLDQLMIDEYESADGHTLGPRNVYEYLHRVMYHRRSQFNFLWNTLLVGGIKDGEKFLGCVDMKGVTYTSPTIATGFGAYLAQPILRKAVEGREDQIDEAEARKIMDKVMRVLFYRDARSLNKIQVSVVTEKGVDVSEPRTLQTEWAFAESISGYGAAQP